MAAVKAAAAGDSAGYGRLFVADRDTELGTLPIGYADGIRRAFTNNMDVLIGGRRHPLVGAVSMDNLTVEIARAGSVETGAEADDHRPVRIGAPERRGPRRTDRNDQLRDRHGHLGACAARVPSRRGAEQ